MKILLTGATGGLGYRTLENLIKNQDVKSIIASGRTIKPSHFVKHPKIDYQLGNLEDFDFVRKLVKQVDCIVHAAALSSPWGKYNEFKKANLDTQINLIKAAKEVKIKRFIYISTPSIYYNAKANLNVKETEEITDGFINAYAKTKYEAEIELQKSKIPYVILRPRALIGRGDNVIMPRLIRAFDDGKLKIIGNGKNIVDLTSLENVADAIELSLTVEGNGLNQTYNITNGEVIDLWKSIEKVLSLLGRKLSKQKVPYFIVKLLAQILELKSKMTDFKEPALTVYSIRTIAKSFTLDISKAEKLLGYKPKVSIEEAIIEFVNWYEKLENK
jgi:nucleoside-diphosphate-sugar epimerase